jgi:hypothetical protein
MTIALTPVVEVVPFTLEHPPRITLNAWERSSPGSVRVAEPHSRLGGRFAFKVFFEPALREGETAHYDLDIDFPEYRIGVKEDFILAQLDAGRTPIVDYQQNARSISRPTRSFTYRVVIPRELGAYPIDPVVARYDHPFPDEENFVRRDAGVYSVSEQDVDGRPCWVMELRRENPPYEASYKLRWRPPSRKDLQLPAQPG